ncbi:hypothetical protein CEUSTIGMA_g1472.t1 [Chlamydomonas eustigma]|uniref:WPP domain-containing protein n=1 Tax=Chlamydomonas eustigma TaxID=1157962 RepID=A0A250WTR5_9CHLO|nr:hypothetical protein CEUSTIGMA_g1472.t1 [Chlamydomonas eustigma]|eukprot:GAX74022.1 hypothetical protein CEUSTIGMA_g1472.t1 [Chlamydomonas eustigma]
MAWGRGSATQGLDDICERLRKNDPKLASLTILKHRKFDHTEVAKLCNSLGHNTVLKELYASNHSINADSALLISQLLAVNSSLTSLCIGNSSFGDAGVAALHDGLLKSASLVSVDFENKGISKTGTAVISEILHSNKILSHVNIARNPVGDEGLSALCSHPWGSLTHLDLRSCELGPMSMQHMAEALGHFTAPLSILHLSHNTLGAQAGVHLSAILRHASSLTQLYLIECSLGDAGVQGLAPGVAKHDALERLDLNSNGLSSTGSSAVASALSESSSLLRLELGDNPNISAKDIAELARSLHKSQPQGVQGVQVLNISSSKLNGAEGIEAIDQLASTKVKSLCLLGTSLGNSGAERLAYWLSEGGFSSLQELSLSGCDLELHGGLSLVLKVLQEGHAPALQVLECGANPACQAEDMVGILLSLRESRPSLSVHWNAGDESGNFEQEAAQ